MSTPFDAVAGAYTRATPEPAVELVGLVLKLAGGQSPSNVVELGCGSGRLALALASQGHSVVGVDSSSTMIALARQADCSGMVQWENLDVEHFDFGSEAYDLVIAYEAFHLFREQEGLVQRISMGLRPGGYLMVAWTDYEWEEALHKAIVECFAAVGVSWADWGYWRCPHLTKLVSERVALLSEVRHESMTVSSSSSVGDVADFLVSLDKTAHLDQRQRRTLRHCIGRRARAVFGGEWSVGASVSTIAFARRLSAADLE